MRFAHIVAAEGPSFCLQDGDGGLTGLHALEPGHETLTCPALFSRFDSSLTGHGEAVVKPNVSDAFDDEAEMVVAQPHRGRGMRARRGEARRP